MLAFIFELISEYLCPRSCQRHFTFANATASLICDSQKLGQRVFGISMSNQTFLLSLTKYRICDSSLVEYRPD